VSCITVNINIVTDDYPDETSWTIADEDGSEVASSSIGDVTPCLESNKVFTFSISDDWGDGICCSHGDGSYKLYRGEAIFIEGGEFGHHAEHTFFLLNQDTVLVDHSTCAGEVKKGAGDKCSESQQCLSNMCESDGKCA